MANSLDSITFYVKYHSISHNLITRKPKILSNNSKNKFLQLPNKNIKSNSRLSVFKAQKQQSTVTPNTNINMNTNKMNKHLTNVKARKLVFIK